MIAAAADAVGTPWQLLAIAFASLGEILSVVFVFRVLTRGGSPSSTLLWMLVILATPWLGLGLYYLLPRQLQLRRLRSVRRRGSRMRQARGRPGRPDETDRGGGLRALLDGGDGSRLESGNDVEWLSSGGEFFRAAAEAIAAARSRVDCVVYIVRADSAGQRFLDLLIAAARRGVAVRLVYDSFGSFGVKASFFADLIAAGGRAEPFLPLLWKRRPFTVNLRNHRKLLVVDGEIGFLGGRNIGDEYFTDRLGRTRPWLDAMIRVRGPAVAHLEDVFAEDWCTATEEVLPRSEVPVASGTADVAIACSGPDRERSDLWFGVVQAIGEAKHTLDLCSPYLVPPPTLLFAIDLAAARGVRVRIWTNGPKAEAAVLYHAQRSQYRGLLAAGIEVFESVDAYTHAKLLVMDGRTLIVGSANLDQRSANLNFEVAAVVVDAPRLCARVLQTIAERRSSFRRLTTADLPTNPFARALDGGCGLLAPLL